MKERIVIEIPKDMCDNCNGCDKPTSALVECYLDEPRQAYETVKVPENFAELRELCKELEGKKIITTSTGIIVEDDCIEFHGLQFWASGIISHETEIDKGLAIRLNRTPQQMWDIIKSLVEEQ